MTEYARNTAQRTMLGSGAAAFELQRLLSTDPGRTVVWSPFSVGSALGLLWSGAVGDTAAQLGAALAPGWAPHQLATMATAAVSEDPMPGAQLLAATMLWADRQLPIRDAYRADAQGWPGGTVRTVDFAADPAGARDVLNDAVERATHGLISQLLGPADVGADTLAVLISAFWLRIRWERPFDQAATRSGDFETPRGTRDVPMMSDVRRVPYARIQRDGQWWSLVSLPAGGIDCDLVLPDRPEIRPTDPELLAELRAASRPRMVDLRLPRTKVQSRLDLTEPLARLGIPNAFSDAAEFPRISPVATKVDAVVHQAVLGIDETGAEAAAATAATMVLAAAVGHSEKPVAFHVNRPYLVVLRHRRTGVSYVSALITEP